MYVLSSAGTILCATIMLWEWEQIEVGQIFGQIFDCQGIYLEEGDDGEDEEDDEEDDPG